LALDPKLTLAESQLTASIPGVRLVDLTSQLCSDTTCPARINGKIVYRDASHLSHPFAASLAEPLRAALFPTVE
jgi:hypothetical protein